MIHLLSHTASRHALAAAFALSIGGAAVAQPVVHVSNEDSIVTEASRANPADWPRRARQTR